MISRWFRTFQSRYLRPLLGLLDRLGITPDALTLISLLATIAAGVFIALGYPIAGGLLFLAGSLCDSLDGELARYQKSDTSFGGFIDSICDHIGDFALALGLLAYTLAHGERIEPFLVLAGLFGSVFGSHVRSRAGMLGIDLKSNGLFTRAERSIVLILGLISGLLTPALWVLTIMNNLSALERVWKALQSGRRQRAAREDSPI